MRMGLIAGMNGRRRVFAPTGDPFATKLAANIDCYITGPNIPASTSGITMLFDIELSDGTSSGYTPGEFISQTFELNIDTRAGQRNLSFNMEDNAGVRVFNTVGFGGPVPTTRCTIVISATQDRGDGNAEFKCWLDGVLLHSATATTSGTGFFSTIRQLRFVDTGNADAKLYAMRCWTAYTSTGDTAALGAAYREIEGDATVWNNPPAGLTKAGLGLFT